MTYSYIYYFIVGGFNLEDCGKMAYIAFHLLAYPWLDWVYILTFLTYSCYREGTLEKG